jgi:two-component system sensor histidine kinase KdpD
MFRNLPRLPSVILEYGIAVTVILSVAFLCYPISSIVGYRTVSLILLLVTALLALKLSRWPVLAAAILAALAWNFLFIPPLFSFTMGHLDDAMMFVAFILVAVVTGNLTARIREREQVVIQREKRTAALFALTKDLSSAHSQEDVVNAAIRHVGNVFGADVCMLVGEPDGDMAPPPLVTGSWEPVDRELESAAWSYWNERPSGRNCADFPDILATFYPISGPRYPLGVIGIRPRLDAVPSQEQRSLVDNFIAQIASAIEREMLNELTKRASVLAESERLYNTVLNSISHELRTPIAAILGAAENLDSQDEDGKTQPKKMLVGEIHSAAQRLNRVISNLLDMSRLESGTIRLRTDWCDVRDLVQAALRASSQELGGHPVSIECREDIPLIKGDFGLLEQALANLLVNAAVHTPPHTSITVNVRAEVDSVTISVIDEGPGIAANALHHIFEKFYRVAGTPSGGTGLGLPIARGFIEAHHGTVTASNRDSGGTKMTVVLPIGEKAST